MLIRRLIYINILLIAACLTACKNDAYLYRDVSSRIWLGWKDTIGSSIYTKDSVVSSFMLLPATAEKDTLYITANVTGITAAADRPFSLEVVQEKTNVSVADYQLGTTLIPANAFSARIPVIVNRNVTGLDLSKQRAELVLHFVPNDNFLYAEPGLDTFRVVWYNFLPRPDSWTAVQSVLGNFSQAKYKFILDFYGDIDFERYRGNTNLQLGLQSALRKALRDYNANPANEGRPEGWPYLDDNGAPLTF